MTVPFWRPRPDSTSKSKSDGPRKHRLRPRRASVEQLETRQLLTFSASLTGTTATFTVGGSPDSIVFTTDGAGDLEHNTLTAPAGQSFADDLDFDSSLPGSQHLAASALSTVDLQGGAYDATIGTPTSPASTLLAQFNLAGNSGSSATVDDSGSTAPTAYTATSTAITATGINVALTGPAFGGVSLTTGTGTNTANILSTTSPLTLTNPGGADAVTLGNAGIVDGLTGTTTIAGTAGTTAVTVDDSANTADKDSLLAATGANTASLTEIAPAAINLSTGGGNTLSILEGLNAASQRIDFAQGNPIPNGLTFSGGTTASLFLTGDPSFADLFSNDTYDATGPGSGTINLDGSIINFTNAKPYIDVVSADNFVFNDQIPGDNSIVLGPGEPIDNGTSNPTPTTLLQSNTFIPQFAGVYYGNKDFNVTVNTGPGNDTVLVDSSSLNARMTTIDGQGGTNVLNYLADGAQIAVTPTSIAGQVLITRSDTNAVVLAENFSRINITGRQVPSNAIPLHGFAGGPLTNVDVDSFTAVDPNATTTFSATIDWGDGNPSGNPPGQQNPSAGTIVPDASDPTRYFIEGSHTYTASSPAGGYPVAVTVSESDVDTTTVPGVTINETGTGTSTAPATIAGLASTSPAAPIGDAVEGTPFTGTIATFTDNDPSAPAGRFNATIAWGDGQVTQGTVTADPSTPGQFLVDGTHTYTKAGSYSAVVTVQDTIAPVGSPITIARTVTVAGAAIALNTTPFGYNVNVLQPFTDQVGTFTSANPLASASDFVATIDWGDGTGTTPGVITEGADGTFSVVGSHTYGVPTPTPGAFDHVKLTVSEPGGQTATQPNTSEYDVFDGPLMAQGATITAVEGQPTSGAVVASFSYNGPASLAFETSNFSGEVDWGDGTRTFLNSSNFQFAGGIDESYVNYLVKADHTYLGQGTFPVTVTIDSNAGSQSVTHSTALVADALTVTLLPPAPVEGVPFYNLAVATFADTGTPDPAAKYSATINFGDGTAVVPGTVVPNADGTFSVLASHEYAPAGSFPFTVTVTDDLDGITSSGAILKVVPTALNVKGQLNPASDSGESDTDAITDDVRPNFFGTVAPGTNVALFAVPVGTTVAVPIGSGVTDASGAWSITSITLADGRYDIEAVGTDPAGATSSLAVLLPNALQGPLVVDTVAPNVESLLYQPLQGKVEVAFQDDSGGLDEAQVINGANYSFERIAALPGQAGLKKGAGLPLPSKYLVTGISTTPQVVPSAAQDVALTINGGKAIRGGFYRIAIKSGGVRDVAGNALDGEFYGYLPSGNNIPGGDFVADLTSIHNTVEPPSAVNSTATPVTPPGTRPTSTAIPTVEPDGIVKETKVAVVHGKAVPQAKVAAKAHVSAKVTVKSHHSK